jgi:BMFP domain-containing protein YqiC
MGILDQLKGAGDMLKGMDPEQIKELLEKAKDSKDMMQTFVREEVEKIIKDMNLVSREEVEKMIAASK